MKEPLAPPTAPDEPAPPADDGRIHTEALDMGAVLAIDRAAQGARLARQAAPAPPPRPAAPEPAPQPAAPAQRPRNAPRAPAAVPIEPGEPGRALASRPGGGPPPPPSDPHAARTIEIDYSPASRLHRKRRLQLRRAARFVLIGAVAVAVGLGLWRLLAGGRAGAPPAPPPLETAPAASTAMQAPAAQPPATAPATAAATATATATATAAVTAAVTAASTVPVAPSGPSRPPSAGTPARPKGKARPAVTSEFPNQ